MELVEEQHGNPVIRLEIESVEEGTVHFTMLVEGHVAEERCKECIDFLHDYMQKEAKSEIRRMLKRYVGVGKRLGEIDYDHFETRSIVHGSVRLKAPFPRCPNFRRYERWTHDYGSLDIMHVLEDGRLILRCEKCDAIRAYPVAYSDLLAMRSRSITEWNRDYGAPRYIYRLVGFVPDFNEDFDTFPGECFAVHDMPSHYFAQITAPPLIFDLGLTSMDDLERMVSYLMVEPAF